MSPTSYLTAPPRVDLVWRCDCIGRPGGQQPAVHRLPRPRHYRRRDASVVPRAPARTCATRRGGAAGRQRGPGARGAGRARAADERSARTARGADRGRRRIPAHPRAADPRRSARGPHLLGPAVGRDGADRDGARGSHGRADRSDARRGRREPPPGTGPHPGRDDHRPQRLPRHGHHRPARRPRRLGDHHGRGVSNERDERPSPGERRRGRHRGRGRRRGPSPRSGPPPRSRRPPTPSRRGCRSCSRPCRSRACGRG